MKCMSRDSFHIPDILWLLFEGNKTGAQWKDFYWEPEHLSQLSSDRSCFYPPCLLSSPPAQNKHREFTLTVNICDGKSHVMHACSFIPWLRRVWSCISFWRGRPSQRLLDWWVWPAQTPRWRELSLHCLNNQMIPPVLPSLRPLQILIWSDYCPINDSVVK